MVVPYPAQIWAKYSHRFEEKTMWIRICALTQSLNQTTMPQTPLWTLQQLHLQIKYQGSSVSNLLFFNLFSLLDAGELRRERCWGFTIQMVKRSQTSETFFQILQQNRTLERRRSKPWPPMTPLNCPKAMFKPQNAQNSYSWDGKAWGLR